MGATSSRGVALGNVKNTDGRGEGRESSSLPVRRRQESVIVGAARRLHAVTSRRLREGDEPGIGAGLCSEGEKIICRADDLLSVALRAER